MFLIFVLLSAVALSATASAASDFTVDSIDYTAELRSDGCAYVTEVWTVTFVGDYEGFSREIVIPEDNFEAFGELRDITVSVDGNLCSQAQSDELTNGTYTSEKGENSQEIIWHLSGEDKTHTFSLRYLKTDAVKLYNGLAYFYTTVVNSSDAYGICRDVSISIKTQKKCFSEDFTVLQSGSIAGKKSDNEIVFSADNSAGLVKIGISLPSATFEQGITEIVDNNTGKIIGIILLVLSAAGVGFGVWYFTRHYRSIYRKHMEKKCRRKVYKEASYEAHSEIFSTVSPARVMTLVSDCTISGADRFIVTALELLRRGYIAAGANGFTASEHSSADDTGRPLDRFEKAVIEFFGSGKWEKTTQRPLRFYIIMQKLYRKIPFITPEMLLTSEGRRVALLCFELRLSAKRHEFVCPEEISDDAFRGGKYTTSDLLISVFNEYDLSSASDFVKPDTEKFSCNLFLLRNAYDEGEKQYATEQLRRKMQKARRQNKHSETVTDNGDDSQ